MYYYVNGVDSRGKKKKQETLKIILLIEFLRQQSAPHNSTRFPHLSTYHLQSNFFSKDLRAREYV